MLLNLALLLILLVFNACFSALEFGLMTVKKDKLQAIKSLNQKRKSKVFAALNHLMTYLTTTQFGITICSILVGYFGESSISGLLSIPLAKFNIHMEFLTAIIGTLLVVFLHMVLGEMVPKNIALAQPEKTASNLINFGIFFRILFTPFITIFTSISALILKLFGVRQQVEISNHITEIELLAMLDDSHNYGYIDQIELERISKSLAYNHITIAKEIIPFKQTKILTINTTVDTVNLQELKDLVSTTGFSRFPIATENKELIGYVHVKDMLSDLTKENLTMPTREFMRKIHNLPTLNSKLTIGVGIETLRQTKSHLAQVLGANLQPIGIVTLEDLVEELVGTVNDKTHR